MLAHEHALPPAEELLTLLDALPASVALWDGDVRLRYGNHRSLTRFRRPYEELLGARLSDLVSAHAVELSAQYIDGALAGRPQQVERAMVDAYGQRFNAHQVTHIPNLVDGVVQGYCALAVDITASLEGYEQARHARELSALRAERERIAGDIVEQHVADELNAALYRLGAVIDRAPDMLSSLADAIDRSIEELRVTVPARMVRDQPEPIVAFPAMSVALPLDATDGSSAASAGVAWPPSITGNGWTAGQAAALLDLLPIAIATWDVSLCCTYVNAAAVRWFGRTDASSVLGQHVRDVLGETAYESNRAFAQAALRGETQQFDRTVEHPSGPRHLQAWYVPRLVGDEVAGMHSVIVDVTARVEAELALQDARAELASMRERERIADDLHNLVIQRLFAAGLTASLPSLAEGQVRSLQDNVMAALNELDSAISTLHEGADLLDVLPDLAFLVHDATAPHAIAAAIENVGSVEYIPPATGVELLGVAELALSNVVRHSGATTVVVTVAADPREAWLRVADDGRGMRPDASGAGMAEMVARAQRLGGTCTWRANEPSGTLVDWRVPI